MMDTATLTKEEPPVYATSKEPRRVTIGHGAQREVWWEVLKSDGRVLLHETLGQAKRFIRENRRPT